MSLRWTDIQEIALGLLECHADVDPLQIRFTDLQQALISCISLLPILLA